MLKKIMSQEMLTNYINWTSLCHFGNFSPAVIIYSLLSVHTTPLLHCSILKTVYNMLSSEPICPHHSSTQSYLVPLILKWLVLEKSLNCIIPTVICRCPHHFSTQSDILAFRYRQHNLPRSFSKPSYYRQHKTISTWGGGFPHIGNLDPSGHSESVVPSLFLTSRNP